MLLARYPRTLHSLSLASVAACPSVTLYLTTEQLLFKPTLALTALPPKLPRRCAPRCKVWSTSRPWWERIPPRHVFYYRSVKHCNAYVLSWFYVFEKENETYSFAYRHAMCQFAARVM